MPNFPWAPVDTLGMYGIGFLVFLAVAFFFARPIKQAAVGVAILLAVTILASLFFAFLRAAESERPSPQRSPWPVFKWNFRRRECCRRHSMRP